MLLYTVTEGILYRYKKCIQYLKSQAASQREKTDRYGRQYNID